MGFAFGDHQRRTSGASTALPIWVNGSFRPVRVRRIRGKNELLPGMHIVKKHGAQVCFGCDRFNVGHGEWKMMTFNEENRWVFPLVPTSCAYAKLDGYFGKLRKSEIHALQIQGDFGGNLAVRKVVERKWKIGEKNGEIQRDNSRYERYNAKFTITSGGYHFWIPRKQNDFENLKEIGKLFHLEDDFGNMQKRARQLGKSKKCG